MAIHTLNKLRSFPHSCSTNTKQKHNKPMCDKQTLSNDETNATRIVRSVCPNGNPMMVQAEYCETRGVDMDTVRVYPIVFGLILEPLPRDPQTEYFAAMGLMEVLEKIT